MTCCDFSLFQSPGWVSTSVTFSGRPRARRSSKPCARSMAVV